MREGLRRYRYRKFSKLRKDRIEKSLTNEEAFCYLGRYPNIAKGVGRHNLFKGKEHWYTQGRHKNLDKSCPYTIPKDEFEQRQLEKDTIKNELDAIISKRKNAGAQYIQKKESIVDLDTKINNYTYDINDKQYSVPELDINKLFLENEGFSNHTTIEGLTGMNAYIDDLTGKQSELDTYLQVQNDGINNQNERIAFLDKINEDAKKTLQTLQEITTTAASEKENDIRKIKKQNDDIDNIIIENTKNTAGINYKRGQYLSYDTEQLKIFNQYYLFWIYVILFVVVSFILLTKGDKYSKKKIYILLFILAIYPFTIGMLQQFGYMILYKIYDLANFNIYNKT
jgi:GrpB-like predicted nucleotidyltransferase (UPF0157 family)